MKNLEEKRKNISYSLSYKKKKSEYLLRIGSCQNSKHLRIYQKRNGFEFEIKHIVGKSFKINNIDGNVIKPFFKKKIPELGMIRGGKKGCLIISFEVEFPDTLSHSQKEQIKDIF